MTSLKSLSCSWCKKTVVRYPSQSKKKWGVFCSKKCLGLFRSDSLTGTRAANFKSGTQKDRKYIKVLASWHPYADKKGTVYLHRIIAEARLSRFLDENEIVHHIDGNPENNFWNNLIVCSQSEHALEHIINGTIGRNKKTGRLEAKNENI